MSGLCRFTLLAVLCSVVLAGCARKAEDSTDSAGEDSEPAVEGFVLSSPAFTNNGEIPPRHTADGADMSPPLTWTEPPDETRALVLICEDLDTPDRARVHWVLYDIPASTDGLPENLPQQEKVLEWARHGRNDFQRLGYNGPSVPRGELHRYSFRLYAVSKLTTLPGRVTKDVVMRTIEGNILAEAELVGTFKR